MSNNKTVYVGMSGGVDSSVTAALLKDQGYTVVGVYMKNWTQDMPGMICPWMEDYQDAKRVAVQLGIDFKVYDFQAEYRERVVDYMIEGYKAGITPNPDIMCNQEVKFKLFLETALADGADMIATGHYARIVHDNSADQNHASLLVGKDNNKDQSYFLYRVTGSALAKSIMPIGEYHKPQVRELARKFGLATASKKDSQGICFVGKVGIREFLEQFVRTEPGAIIDQAGREIGQHDGALFYTIGQRHGLNVGGGLPYYVVGKNMDNNQVYVTTDIQDVRLWQRTIWLSALHWIGIAPTEHRTYRVRTRYRAPLVRCEIEHDAQGQMRVMLQGDVRAITPGQSAVLYDGDYCLGGGIVCQA